MYINYEKESKDYYAILGLKKDANKNKIKQAYKGKVKTLEESDPKSVANVVLLTNLSEAYEILNYKNNRDLYDNIEKRDQFMNGYSFKFKNNADSDNLNNPLAKEKKGELVLSAQMRGEVV